MNEISSGRVPDMLTKMILSERIARSLELFQIDTASLLVAVSGGRDSMALLTALHAQVESGSIPLFGVLLVNHHLRESESEDEATFVREQCAQLHVPFTELNGSLEASTVKLRGIEGAARETRYRLMQDEREKTGARHIATAHHLQDQAETVLMRILSGSALPRLRGIRETTPEGLVRPMLHATRAEIDDWLVTNGVPFREDSSNRSGRFLRNRIRSEVIPLLETLNPRVSDALSKLAREVAETEEALSEYEQAITREITESSFTFETTGASRGTLRRMLREGIGRLASDPREISSSDLERILDSLQEGCRITLAADLELRMAGSKVTISRPLRSKAVHFDLPVQPGQPLQVEDISGRLELTEITGVPPQLSSCAGNFDRHRGRAGPTQFEACGEEHPHSNERPRERARAARPYACADFQIFELQQGADASGFRFRTRRDGDRFSPLGAGGSKSLSDFLINRKIARDERSLVPLLTWNEEIVWVCGVEVSDRFRVRNAGGRLYKAVLQYE